LKNLILSFNSRSGLPSHRHGFTLAEVLITLGIIGVIAAITIQNLITNYQKTQTVVQLQKTYTSLAQAGKQSESDNGSSQSWDLGTTGDGTSLSQSFSTYWAPYLKISKYCSSTSNCGYNTAMFYRLDGTYTGYSGPNDGTLAVLSDGTIFFWRHSNLTENIFFVDINGVKTPNTYGKDVFIFSMDSTKGLVPYSYTNDTSATINANCSKSGQGQTCAIKIMMAGWKIEDDYPW